MSLISRNFLTSGIDSASLGEPQRAVRIEGTDAPATVATGYTMLPGDTFNGTLGSGDTDWVRVTLQPGTYLISLDSRGASGVSDPYLRVLSSNGSLVVQDDDSGSGLNARLSLTVTTAGTYYLEAGAYASYDTGAYSLSLAALRNFTMPEIARQLTDGYWQESGQSRRSFDAGQGTVLNVDLSGLTVAGRVLADRALATWEAVTGIVFNRNPGAGATIHIRFDDDDYGAYSESLTSGTRLINSSVNVGLDWLRDNGTGFNGYSYQTYIHEIGHALGLGHAGNYNGSATYGIDNHYPNDSWQASVMSYFDQAANTAVDASYAYIVTPMIADILAMQTLYGPTSVRTGNNTYGEQSNAGAAYTTIATMLRNIHTRDDIAFTIFDQGGVDTLDLSSDGLNQRISLVQGSYSDAYGLVGNIGIAYGTVIENLLAGAGNDRLTGNAANNLLVGGAGNDTLYGAAGDDRLQGGAGRDVMHGGLGNDTYWADGADTIVELAGAGVDTVRAWSHFTLGANVENLVLSAPRAQNGTGNALANHITGNDYANRIEGGAGNDTLLGLAGNDTLLGGAGADWLSGGAGLDLLNGGAGNDTYVTDGRDQIVELVGGGVDTVRSIVSLQLGANLENLVLVGTGPQNGIGNALANRITGSGYANVLNGGGGNDTLFGGAGADHFVFSAGRDVILDFQDNIDTLRIDDVLWGGAARTVAQVLQMASVVAGNTVFSFGNGHSLTLNGFTNIAALQDDLIII